MLAIIIASVAVFAFGAFWFTVLFGKKWAELMDFNPASNDKYKDMGMAKPLVLNFLTNVIIAGVVYSVLPQILSLGIPAYKALLVIWLGFSFPIFANAAIWERKSWKLVVINSAQSLISLFILASIIYYMQ